MRTGVASSGGTESSVVPGGCLTRQRGPMSRKCNIAHAHTPHDHVIQRRPQFAESLRVQAIKTPEQKLVIGHNHRSRKPHAWRCRGHEWDELQQRVPIEEAKRLGKPAHIPRIFCLLHAETDRASTLPRTPRTAHATEPRRA